MSKGDKVGTKTPEKTGAESMGLQKKNPRWEVLPFLPQTNAHKDRVPDEALTLFDSSTKEKGLSYGDLRARVAVAAHTIAEASHTIGEASHALEMTEKGEGEFRKDLIVCCAPRSLDGLIAYLTSAGSGHAVAMMDPDMPHKADFFKAYAPLFIIAPPKACDGILRKSRKCDNVLRESRKNEDYPDYEELESPFGTLGLWRRVGQDQRPVNPDLFLILLTSGSTGSCKGVRLSYDNVRANTESIIKSLNLSPATRALAHLPLSYSFGLSIAHMQLASGGSLVLSEDGLMTGSLWDLARACKANLFAGVPYHYEMLLKLGLARLRVPDLRCFLQAGGKMQPTTTKALLAHATACDGEVYIMYGQTEAAPRMSCFALHKFPEKLGSSGRALDGGLFTISEDGEIIYEGPNVMMGYAQSRDDLAAGDVMHHRLATGDVGNLDADGFLTITGRLQRFAKLFGQRIALDDLEKIAYATAGEARHVALEAPEKIVLFTTEARQDLRERIKENLLAETKLPSTWLEIRAIADLPHKANGKTDYQKLKESL